MEQEDQNKIKLGVFVILAVIVFAVGIFLVGDKENMFGSRFTITAVFNDIAGLKVGNNVRFAGINAGTVKDIEMLNDTSIRVYMLIRESEGKHIRQNAIASIATDGLLGDKLVNIKPSGGASNLVKEGDELMTYRAVETEMMMETLQKTNENIALISESLVEITGRLNEGSGTLGMLLKDETLASNLSAAAKNINAVSRQANLFTVELNEMVNKMNSDQSAMGALIADTTLGASIEETINNLKDASAQTTEFAKKLDELVQNINTGEGAAGTVINDTEFNADMEETMRNLKEGTDNFNQNMEALKTNFLFRRYFKKQEKERQKNQ